MGVIWVYRGLSWKIGRLNFQQIPISVTQFLNPGYDPDWLTRTLRINVFSIEHTRSKYIDSHYLTVVALVFPPFFVTLTCDLLYLC